MNACFFVAATALALPLAPAFAWNAPDEEILAIRAAQIDLGDGQRVEDGVMLVENGTIRAVGRGVEIPQRAAVIDHDGVLTAGIVAFHATVGATGDSSDATRSFLPQARMAHAYRRAHPEFEDAWRAGITAVVLSPSPAPPIGGRTAVVKTGVGSSLLAEGPLAINFSGQALSPSRPPTSLAGLSAELEELWSNTGGAPGQTAEGQAPVLIEAWSRHEISLSASFAQRHELRGALIGAPLAGELLEEIQKSGLGVVVGPWDGGMDQRVLKSVAALGEAGVPLGFAGGLPWRHPESLRLGAAMCVRYGLDASVAWKALTSDAARLAGVGDRIGRLERGFDADFVLWSGDPLELSSVVEAVFVDGRRQSGQTR